MASGETVCNRAIFYDGWELKTGQEANELRNNLEIILDKIIN